MIEKIKQEIERRVDILTHIYAEMVERKDDEMRTYYHGKIVAIEELLSFIESLEKEQPKRKLRKVCNLREDLKADKPIEERLEELRKIRAEKDRLDEAAGEYMEHIPESEPELMDSFYDWEQMEAAFKAGAKWRDAQMKVPNSTELIAEWHEVKDILKEKDFRGDQWRLAYQAFMFGFSRGLNTKK